MRAVRWRASAPPPSSVCSGGWRSKGTPAPDGSGGGDSSSNYLRDVAATVFLAAWVPLFASFSVLLVYPSDGSGRVFCLMIGVVCSDVGGYAVGVLFGKHPMVPSISPKKSWEGLAGSLLFGDHRGHV